MFWKKFFIVVGTLIILAFIAQLTASPYIKGLIIRTAKESLGLEISIGNCAVSLLSRKIILEDITIPNPEYKDDYFIKAKEISADFYLMPLLFNKQVLREVSVTKPEVILHLDEAGALKLPRVKKEEERKAAKKSEGKILFGRFLINNGNLKFIDHRVSKPATLTMFSGVNCDISNSFSIGRGKVITKVDLSGKIEEQGRLSVKGEGDFLSEPVSFNGDMNIENLPLPEFAPYYANFLSVIVKSGNASLYTKAACDEGSLNINSNARIDSLNLEPIGDPSQTLFFELKTSDVIEFLKDENNTVKFSFNVSGDLTKPDFKWGPEVQRALKDSMLRAFTEGAGRLLQKTLEKPAEVGEKVGEIIGGEAGENVKKIGEQLQKIFGK